MDLERKDIQQCDKDSNNDIQFCRLEVFYEEIVLKHIQRLKKDFMAPFYRWGSTASRLEPLRGGSLLFTTKFSEVPGTLFIDHGKMKG